MQLQKNHQLYSCISLDCQIHIPKWILIHKLGLAKPKFEKVIDSCEDDSIKNAA